MNKKLLLYPFATTILSSIVSAQQDLAVGVGLSLFMVFFMLIFFALAILAFILWIFMVIDCVKRDFRHENDKIAWILVIVLLGVIGALVYYFVVRRKEGKA